MTNRGRNTTLSAIMKLSKILTFEIIFEEKCMLNFLMLIYTQDKIIC